MTPHTGWLPDLEEDQAMSETHRCPLCSTWRSTPGTCQQIRCLACGAEQCHSRGHARGCCHVCHYGRLPGWSFSSAPATCQYTGCTAPAVYAYLPGAKRHCCKAHGDEILTRIETKRQERQSRYRHV